MASSSPVKEVVKQVRPLLSRDRLEAKQRVLSLYREFYRNLLFIKDEHSLPFTLEQMRDILRREFLKHKNVTDTRAIDMLILQGKNELCDFMRRYRFTSAIYYKYKRENDSAPQSKDFLFKFLKGND